MPRDRTQQPAIQAFTHNYLACSRPKMPQLIGMTIAIELLIEGTTRVVRGVIVDAEPTDNGTTHAIQVAVDDPDGTGGSPVLMIPRAQLRQDDRFGCDYYLKLASNSSAPADNSAD